MSDLNKAFSRYLALGIILLVLTMMLFQMNDPYGVKILLLLIGLIVLKPAQSIRLSWIDASVGFLWLYDIISGFTGINSFSVWQATSNATLCLVGYGILRVLFTSNRSLRLFLQSLCFPVAVALCLSVLSFFLFRRSVETSGFTDLYPFRFLFRPLGYITNAWSAILIPFLGLISLSCYYASAKVARQIPYLLLLCGTILAIGLSFSRGAYVAFGLYVGAFLFLVKPYREKIKLLSATLLVGVVICFSFPRETLTTLRMGQTVSQQQSTQGRIQGTQAALQVFRKHIGWGAGVGNYTLAMDKKLNQDSTRSYTSYAPNLIVQLGIEKGLAGYFLSAFLFICVMIKLWQRQKDPVCMIIGCTLLAVLVKELTLSVLPVTPILLFLCCILLAILQRQETDKVENVSIKEQRLKYVFLGSVFVWYLGFGFHSIRHQRWEAYNSKSMSAFQKGNREEAIFWIEKTPRKLPYLINRGILYKKYFDEVRESDYLQKAAEELQEANRSNPEDVFVNYLLIQILIQKGADREAFVKLKQLTELYPKNALFQYQLFRLTYQNGRTEEAARYLNHAIVLSPGILNEKQVECLKQTNPVFYHSLVAGLLKNYPLSDEWPTSYAHYGFIAYQIGEMEIAEKNLINALSALPNLSTPWFLLSKIYEVRGDKEKAESCARKAALLKNQAFQSASLIHRKQDEKEDIEKESFRKYAVKFSNWYESKLYKYK